MKSKKSKKVIPSQTFEEKKQLIKMQVDAIKIKQKLKMEELAYKRETERIYHEKALERERIKSAEIRKSQMRRDAFHH